MFFCTIQRYAVKFFFDDADVLTVKVASNRRSIIMVRIRGLNPDVANGFNVTASS